MLSETYQEYKVELNDEAAVFSNLKQAILTFTHAVQEALENEYGMVTLAGREDEDDDWTPLAFMETVDEDQVDDYEDTVN